MKIISVIVPVYNSEKYLEECINSLIAQTYSPIEIILVDNKSTDKSLEICKRYEEKYSNVRVCICEVKGAAAARNLGIQQSRGEYLMFVDSDDFVDKNYCLCMINEMILKKADICVCGIRRIDETYKLINEQVLDDFDVDEKDNNIQGIFLNLYKEGLLNAPVNKIYKKCRVTCYFNNEFQIGEDLLFNLKYIENDKIHIVGINKVLYSYRIFEKLSKQKLEYYSQNRLNSNLLLYKELRKIAKVKQFDNAYLKNIQIYFANEIVFCIKEWIEVGYSKKIMKQKINEVVNNEVVHNIACNRTHDLKKDIILYFIKKKRKKILYIIMHIGQIYLNEIEGKKSENK